MAAPTLALRPMPRVHIQERAAPSLMQAALSFMRIKSLDKPRTRLAAYGQPAFAREPLLYV